MAFFHSAVSSYFAYRIGSEPILLSQTVLFRLAVIPVAVEDPAVLRGAGPTVLSGEDPADLCGTGPASPQSFPVKQ